MHRRTGDTRFIGEAILVCFFSIETLTWRSKVFYEFAAAVFLFLKNSPEATWSENFPENKNVEAFFDQLFLDRKWSIWFFVKITSPRKVALVDFTWKFVYLARSLARYTALITSLFSPFGIIAIDCPYGAHDRRDTTHTATCGFFYYNLWNGHSDRSTIKSSFYFY